MFLSIVTTLYQSEPYVEQFYARISREAAAVTDDFEVIFVNDGSPDQSLEMVLGLSEQDRRVRVIDLSRNFGHHKAIMTGLCHARGDLVFLIDSDLEEEPESLRAFIAHMRKTRADVVYGVQTSRKGGIFERVTGSAFYALYNLLSDDKIPPNLTVARLMTRRYVSALVRHRDRSPFLGGLSIVAGFAQDSIPLRKTSKGSTAYSLSRKLGLALDSITSFSRKPLICIFYLGVAMLLLATAVALYLITSRVIFGNSVEGWVSLIVSVWWLGGLSIFCTGVVGIYVATLFVESKDRPYTVIRGVYAQGQLDADSVLGSENGVLTRSDERAREVVR